MKASALTHRYIARIEFEAETPLFIGAGRSGALVDALIRTDWNGLPMIPGTALTGVLRHSLDTDEHTDYWNELFGYQDGNEGIGSRLRVSDALMIMHDDQVIEATDPDIPKDIRNMLSDLPVRKHVCISKKGAAEKNGLFDNQVLPKGARFRCEIMLLGNVDDKPYWESLLGTFSLPTFRIGQGTRNGYGKLKVRRMGSKVFDLNKLNTDFHEFLNWDASLNSQQLTLSAPNKISNAGIKGIKTYQLTLWPDDFFIFGSGQGDEKADSTPVKEWEFVYNEQKKLVKSTLRTLIPATSIKGVLAHRVCYHHNRIKQWFVDNPEDKRAKTTDECPAVKWLFGYPSNEKDHRESGHAGRVMIDDVLKPGVKDDSIFFHVTIDRFTGGALPGFLFTERVNNMASTNKQEDAIILSLHIDMRRIEGYEETFGQALEKALKDICERRLPLGGMTTKGHGVFNGNMQVIQSN